MEKEKEATARIRINKLLEAAGWRFFADASGPANIRLETTLVKDAERKQRGFADFLLQDEKGFPLVVLEAKSADKNPLSGKEQARAYARSENCRFVILSNSHLHYFWDIDRGNPYPITTFPSQDSVQGYKKKEAPDPARLIDEPVHDDYVALTQYPDYAADAAWQNPAERAQFIATRRLRFLRDYQKRAVTSIQQAVKRGHDRFLLEMATGTGKTLTAAAIIKLFLHTGNAQRVLFLVDRLELEDQALKAFKETLANDYTAVIYKENRDDWQHAEIVVSTVQSLLFNNKYQRLFSPTDFDLVISDEAHRSIGGNARAVFNYFIGYKLGLTATPRDYLKNYTHSETDTSTHDPRELERRILRDTYRTFGCEDSQPTFRYSLLDGVRDGYLVNPFVIDARSEVTTQLLSDKGFTVDFGEGESQTFRQRDFEKKFFSQATNELFCATFLKHALRDPISGEIGKSIVFAVSQNHAASLAQIFNEMAHQMFKDKYHSDFAVQVTSQIADAQQMTINFTNNNLLGRSDFLEGYQTSRARICITVGMMTTGYDCPDLLNLGLFRPIFSPTDFIQIKGRGTRRHDFCTEVIDRQLKEQIGQAQKTQFRLFDFFATCEFFEKKFNYDQVLQLPRVSDGQNKGGTGVDASGKYMERYEHIGPDEMETIVEQQVGLEGMRIDREYFARFETCVREHAFVKECVDAGRWDQVIDYVNKKVFNQPNDFYSLEKLRRASGVDRRITLREILEKIFGLIKEFKSKDKVLEEEFDKFVTDYKPASDEEARAMPAIRNYFKAYASSNDIRDIIANGEFTRLTTHPGFSLDDYKAVPAEYRKHIPEYINDYVSLNQFAV